jgi:hypothetical protein
VERPSIDFIGLICALCAAEGLFVYALLPLWTFSL